MASGEQLRTLAGESSSIADGTALAWLPDIRLVSGGYNGQVGIWDPETGKEQVLPKLHTDQVNSVAVSPDGKRIATGSSDKSIVLWDLEKGTARRLRGHRNLVLGLTFDPSGRRLLSASSDNDLRLWDVESGTTLRVFQGHESGLWSVIARNGHAYTAANDGTLRRWSLDRTGQWIWELEGEPQAVQLLPHPADAADVADTPNGELLVGLEDGAVTAYSLPAAASQVTDTPNELDRTKAHDAAVNHFALSPDGKTLATASMDKAARLWRIRRKAGGERGSGFQPRRGAGSGEGLAVENRSHVLSLEPLHSFDKHSGSVHAVAFSPDGHLLATAGYDGQVGLVDVESGEGELSRAAEVGKIVAVQFTPDGSALITANYEERLLRLWQRDGLRLGPGCTIAELTDLPMWASLSPDGRRVAAVGRWFVTLHDLDRSAPPGSRQ
jgi:WD40 repeat protein